jgi:hypothetical protein
LQPITNGATGRQKQQLKEALRLKSRRWFYLPSLPSQPEIFVGNIVDFDEVSLMRKSDLENATRLASLTQFGWHVFAQFLADFYTKPSIDDLKIRRDSGPTKLSIDT